ncbi:hypothetical protein [Desulfosporosinus sp. Sb-LF]|nr:hypothetical protein [Desulfosporosinus sp. Sb-LF]
MYLSPKNDGGKTKEDAEQKGPLVRQHQTGRIQNMTIKSIPREREPEKIC